MTGTNMFNEDAEKATERLCWLEERKYPHELE